MIFKCNRFSEAVISAKKNIPMLAFNINAEKTNNVEHSKAVLVTNLNLLFWMEFIDKFLGFESKKVQLIWIASNFELAEKLESIAISF